MDLVHETATRMRFRAGFIGRPGLDLHHLAALAEEVPGVVRVRINPAAASLVAEVTPDPGQRPRIKADLANLGGAEIPLLEGGREEGRSDVMRPLASGLATLAHPFLSKKARRAATLANIAPTIARGLDALVSEGIGVDVLDAASVGLSAVRGEHFTANATQFLLDLAEYLEATTAGHSDAMLRKLLKPNPESAWVVQGERVVKIPFSQVVEGDMVRVGAGEMIPVDGLVMEGEATVNQASVTGESLPIPKEKGSRVLSGTVVEEGRLDVLAERVGDATTTARIARFIEEALKTKPDSQKLAEELADKRVMITLGTAALVFALTRNLRRVESVFLVDYSCAIKLGTPVAIKSAMYRAAKRNILVKGGQAMESLAGADCVVFDKTGTLTQGRLEVTDVFSFDPLRWTERDFLAMVASVAEHTTHPVAAAVVKMARKRDLEHISHEEVDFIVGHGLKTRVGQRKIRIGSRHYLEAHVHVPFDRHEKLIRKLEGEGKTLLYVCGDGEPLGVIALRDTPRPEARATIERLRRSGIESVIMLTGDRLDTANRVAAGLGIDRVFAEAAPEDKAGIISGLKREGRKVLFVGDGVNDGPALTAADIGISMSKSADLARAAASIVLMEDRLEAVAEARELAVSTMGLIKNNFQAAVGINTAILAGASLGLLPPLATALLHNGTTIGILVNALTGGGRNSGS